jgi:hypothetical protein
MRLPRTTISGLMGVVAVTALVLPITSFMRARTAGEAERAMESLAMAWLSLPVIWCVCWYMDRSSRKV